MPTMNGASDISDVTRVCCAAPRDDIDFDVTVNGPKLHPEADGDFEQGEIRALFEYAYRRPCSGFEAKATTQWLPSLENPRLWRAPGMSKSVDITDDGDRKDDAGSHRFRAAQE